MTVEKYNSLSFNERTVVWNQLIAKLNIPDDVAWFPVPFRNETTMTVGYNIVRVEAPDA